MAGLLCCVAVAAALSSLGHTSLAAVTPSPVSTPTPGVGEGSGPAGLPVAFWDGFVGAIAGGILTAIGGFLATWYLDHREAQRESERHERDVQHRRQDRDAAIEIVAYELSTNATKLETYIKFNQFPGRLTDDAFRSVQLMLARELPRDVAVKLVYAYQQLSIAAANVEAMRGVPAEKRPDDLMGVIAEVVRDLDVGRGSITAVPAADESGSRR